MSTWLGAQKCHEDLAPRTQSQQSGKLSQPGADSSIGETDGYSYFDSGDAHGDWLLWQLADSAFPTGGFAHSGGLEAAFQSGELRTAEDLEPFLQASLCQFGHAALPFMLAAHAAPGALVELDSLCDGFLINHVANRASRLQGRALLAAAERVFGIPELQNIRTSDVNGSICYHLAPVFGLMMRSLRFDRSRASRLFCFHHLRGLVSAAVRLGIIGPLQGQVLEHRLSSYGEEILQHCQSLSVSDICQTAPLLDLWQANQDRLYSRLFQS